MTDNPTQLENKLEPCPKCLDCWALQVQEQEPPLLAKTVTCGRCGFRAPFDTWQARIPAQPPFKPMCDDPGCWVCKRMAELHTASTQYGWTKSTAATPTPVELLRPAPEGEMPELVKCEVADCNEPQRCFHYCQEHHRTICLATPSPSLAAREAAEDGEAFPWGTVAIINGEQYWLNQCLKCAPTGQPTYHVIKGEPQPSLNDMMNGED